MGKFDYSCPRDRAKQRGNKGIFKKKSAAKESKYPYIKKHSPVSWRVTIFVQKTLFAVIIYLPLIKFNEFPELIL